MYVAFLFGFSQLIGPKDRWFLMSLRAFIILGLISCCELNYKVTYITSKRLVSISLNFLLVAILIHLSNYCLLHWSNVMFLKIFITLKALSLISHCRLHLNPPIHPCTHLLISNLILHLEFHSYWFIKFEVFQMLKLMRLFCILEDQVNYCLDVSNDVLKLSFLRLDHPRLLKTLNVSLVRWQLINSSTKIPEKLRFLIALICGMPIYLFSCLWKLCTNFDGSFC